MAEYAWPRQRIRSFSIHPGRTGLCQKMEIELVLDDDSQAVISIPWAVGEPMITVQDNVRDILGMSSIES